MMELTDEEILVRGKATRRALENKWYEDKYGKPYYVGLNSRLYRNPDFMKFMDGNKLKILLFLQTNITRGCLKKDKLNLKDNYYCKGKLACSYSYEVLAELCHLERHSLRKHILEMAEKGIIEIEIIDKRKVFVLGYHYNGKETLLIEDVFLQ